MARDLYRQSSSTIELELFAVVFTGVLLIETELRNDENVDIFVDRLFEADEDDPEGEADEDSIDDVFL